MLLLLVSDCCLASILLQLRNSGFIEELCRLYRSQAPHVVTEVAEKFVTYQEKLSQSPVQDLSMTSLDQAPSPLLPQGLGWSLGGLA